MLLKLRGQGAALVRQREALAAFEALAAADPANVAARNDVAISAYKVAELTDAGGNAAGAVPLYQRALDIHSTPGGCRCNNQDLQYQLATGYSSLAGLQGRLSRREPALRHHGRAVEISRTLRTRDTAIAELRVALALALLERARSYVRFAGRASDVSGRGDRDRARLDYAEALDLLTALERDGALQGTDVETLGAVRTELARLTGAPAAASTR